MSDRYVIYCDESGNDGPNYLNEDEPFYVLAGWIMPEEALVEVAVEIENLRQAHCPKADEVKFSMFKRRPWIVCETMERLGRLGLVPIYVVAEKRFCIAAKIVETLLDPYFNSRLSDPFTGDFVSKRHLANTLYDRLSENALVAFAKAYRDPTQAKFEEVLTQIADEANNSVNPEVAHLLEGSREKLAEIAETELAAVESWGKVLGTLNFPCLIAFLMNVEKIGRKQGFHIHRIVHDEHGPYQAGYLKAFEHHRGLAKDDRLFVNGMHIPYGALQMVEDFEFQPSDTQPLVQAADLLAGSIAHLAIGLNDDRVLHAQELELGRFVLPPLIIPDSLLAFPVCSERLLGKFGEAIYQAFPDAIEDFLPEDSTRDVQFTSTLPGLGSLPLLPAKPQVAVAETAGATLVKLDLPLFGIVSDADDRLVLLLPPEKNYVDTPRNETCVPLWIRREAAEEFLEQESPGWTEPHHVVEFGPAEMPELIKRLRGQSEWTDRIVLNMGEVNVAPCPILRLADEIERIWDRTMRAGAAGIVGTLYQTRTINGQQVGTFLLSTGEYAAMQMSDGTRANGATREEAIAQLRVLMDD